MPHHDFHIHVELVGPPGNKHVTFTYERGDATEVLSQLSDKDTFTWCTNSGSLALTWPNQQPPHPFCTDPQPQYDKCPQPSVQVCNLGTYKYSIVLTDGSGTPYPVDPKIIIDGGNFQHFGIVGLLVLAVLAAGAGFWFLRARRKRSAG
jgi:hypothetical protein